LKGANDGRGAEKWGEEGLQLAVRSSFQADEDEVDWADFLRRGESGDFGQMKVSLGAANLQTFCLQVGEISPGKKRYGNTALGQFCPVVGSKGTGSNDGSAWELGNGVLGVEGHCITLREVDFFPKQLSSFV
jgi:hypothetical protein